MRLKVAAKGVCVKLTVSERAKIGAAQELADRIGQLPCDQSDAAKAAATAIDALVKAFEPAA